MQQIRDNKEVPNNLNFLIVTRYENIHKYLNCGQIMNKI